MKLLSVNMTLDPLTGGGTAARTFEASRLLAAAGVDCEILTADEGLDRVPRVAGVGIVGLQTRGGRFRIPVGGFAAMRAAVARADVVLLANHWTIINVLVWRHAVALGRPYVVSPAGALPIEGGRSRWLKRIYNAVAGHAIVTGASAHVAVTSDERQQFAPYGIAPSSVAVVPNALPDMAPGDGARFRAVHCLPDGPLLLFVGRLAPIKGPDLLIEAFSRTSARQPDWHLVVAGPDDGMMGELRTQVRRADLAARVHFVGYVDREATADAMAAADLLVIPSRREAMSIVVLEAGAVGRPVLVTDMCGVPEVADSGGGWIVDATVEGLTSGLDEAMADRAELARRGSRWRTEALRRYSGDAVAALYLEVLRRAMARKAQPGVRFDADAGREVRRDAEADS